jgi:hypothetical protein
MKLFIAAFAVVTLLPAADPQPVKAPAAPKVIQPLQIPAGALESEPGTFRYTDARGKKWIYRKTPFGIARLEDVPSGKALASDKAAGKSLRAVEVDGVDVKGADVQATEDGDTIRFERPGPFGVYKWQKNKSELDEMEQAVWNRQRSGMAAKRPL